MRNIAIGFAVLASALAVPLAAHADAIDDFVLTGGGLDITFSLPASPPGNPFVCPPPISGPTSCQNGSQTDFRVTTIVTDNGVAIPESIDFPTGRFEGGLSLGVMRFMGDQLYLPDAGNPTFQTGSFDLSLFPSSVFPPIDYILTITPEATTAPTPEPSTFVLLGTGALGVITAARRRMAGRRQPG